jgi:hypothetical protein
MRKFATPELNCATAAMKSAKKNQGRALISANRSNDFLKKAIITHGKPF